MFGQDGGDTSGLKAPDPVFPFQEIELFLLGVDPPRIVDQTAGSHHDADLFVQGHGKENPLYLIEYLYVFIIIHTIALNSDISHKYRLL
jgi:hypothetical protein